MNSQNKHSIPHTAEAPEKVESGDSRLNSVAAPKPGTAFTESPNIVRVPFTAEQASGEQIDSDDSYVSSLELIREIDLPLSFEQTPDCIAKAVLLLEHLRISDSNTPASEHAAAVCGLLYAAFIAGEREGELMADFRLAAR